MDFMKLLATERSRSLDAIRAELAAEPNAGWVTEAMIERPGASAIEVFRIMRIDLMAAPDRIREVNVSRHSDFPPFEIRTSGGLRVVVEPFVWNGVEVSVGGIRADDAAIAEWALDWIDLDEVSVAKPDGFLGVIHSMLEPRSVGGRVEIAVDFGSAPIEAVLHLFTVLRERGATDARFTSLLGRE